MSQIKASVDTSWLGRPWDTVRACLVTGNMNGLASDERQEIEAFIDALDTMRGASEYVTDLEQALGDSIVVIQLQRRAEALLSDVENLRDRLRAYHLKVAS